MLGGAQHQIQFAPGSNAPGRARAGTSIAEKLAMFSAPDPRTGCINWLKWTTEKGYGRLCAPGGQKLRAHRASYELAKGPIPDGCEIDHLCRNPRCINPDHLEAVTPQVNNSRSNSISAVNARKTHCKRSHPFDEANTAVGRDGHRICRECRRADAECRVRIPRPRKVRAPEANIRSHDPVSGRFIPSHAAGS